MVISGHNIGPNFGCHGELWSLIKAQREFRRQRKEGQDFVQERLADLLLGVKLNPNQQAQYVRRLVGTASRAEALEMGSELPDLTRARVPRERLLWQVGGLPWRAFPVSQRAVEVTPLHRRLQDRMATALKERNLASPESVRRCVHAVSVRLERGGVAVSWQAEDRVELTGWGQQMLHSDPSETELSLRLPRSLPLYLMELRPNSVLT